MRKYLIAATAAAASGLMAISIPAAQAQGAGGEPPPAGVVSATPASGTPHLKSSDNNPIQQIRQLVQCGNTMYAVGTFTGDRQGQHDLHPRERLQLPGHRALHGDDLGAQRGRHRGHHLQRQRHGQHDRVRQRQLRGCLHRRQVHLGQRHRGPEHRRDRHHDRQRGARLRHQGVGRGADHGRRGESPAGRRQLHRGQRRHRRPVPGQPEPVHRQERRVPAPEHLGQLPVPGGSDQLNAASSTSSSATVARWTWSRATSPRSAVSRGSRSSC